MNIPTRIGIFGSCSGLIWSLAPGLCGYYQAGLSLVLTVTVCAIITGILVSFALFKPLLKANRRITILLGVLALPFGAFCWGFLFFLCSSPSDNPFFGGLIFAFWSVANPLAIIFIPCAVLTTFLLRKWLLMPR
jgi:hypothetical protein